MDLSQIEEIIARDVLKREVLEDPKANDARKKVEKAAKVSLHETDDKDEPENPTSVGQASDKSAATAEPESPGVQA